MAVATSRRRFRGVLRGEMKSAIRRLNQLIRRNDKILQKFRRPLHGVTAPLRGFDGRQAAADLVTLLTLNLLDKE